MLTFIFMDDPELDILDGSSCWPLCKALDLVEEYLTSCLGVLGCMHMACCALSHDTPGP